MQRCNRETRRTKAAADNQHTESGAYRNQGSGGATLREHEPDRSECLADGWNYADGDFSVTSPNLKPAWKPGQSGNPKGMPPKFNSDKARKAALKMTVPILEKLNELALVGDTSAAQMILDRTIPKLRGVDAPIALNLEGNNLADSGRAILTALAAGQLPPNVGNELLSAIGNLVKIIEAAELEQRVAALEGRQGNEPAKGNVL